MGFGDSLMNWGCVPGSLNGWVGDSPLFGLMVLGVRLIPVGSFFTLFFVKPSDDPVSLSKADPRDVMLCSCRLLLRVVSSPLGSYPSIVGLTSSLMRS